VVIQMQKKEKKTRKKKSENVLYLRHSETQGTREQGTWFLGTRRPTEPFLLYTIFIYYFFFYLSVFLSSLPIRLPYGKQLKNKNKNKKNKKQQENEDLKKLKLPTYTRSLRLAQEDRKDKRSLSLNSSVG